MLEKNNERCVSLVYPRLAPDDFNQQFRPGMKIWVTLPTGRTAEIQLDNGQIVTIDVNHYTAAGTPPGSSYPPYNPPPYPPQPYPPQPHPGGQYPGFLGLPGMIDMFPGIFGNPR